MAATEAPVSGTATTSSTNLARGTPSPSTVGSRYLRYCATTGHSNGPRARRPTSFRYPTIVR